MTFGRSGRREAGAGGRHGGFDRFPHARRVRDQSQASQGTITRRGEIRGIP